MDQSRVSSPPRPAPPAPPAAQSKWPSILVACAAVAFLSLAFFLCVPKSGHGQQAIQAVLAQVRALQSELDAVRRQVYEDNARCRVMIGDLVQAVATGRQLPPPPVVLQAAP